MGIFNPRRRLNQNHLNPICQHAIPRWTPRCPHRPRPRLYIDWGQQRVMDYESLISRVSGVGRRAARAQLGSVGIPNGVVRGW